MSSTTTAENYQLKWHSHLSNLNTSVCTLYRNEKFADVMLLTSNQEGGAGIPAHKLILSSCSHYFANIFENNISLPNSLIYVVLPPELSRRSINILVQYMYSGEATVSNDILNEVLRGGELLKIRGLWRNNNQNNHNGHQQQQNGNTTENSNNNNNNNNLITNSTTTTQSTNINSIPQFIQQTIATTTTNEKLLTSTTIPLIPNTNNNNTNNTTTTINTNNLTNTIMMDSSVPITSRIIKRESFSCERSPMTEINTNTNVIPKDSPVIVMSSTSSSSSSSAQQHQQQQHQQIIQNHPQLIIKKDVAIDPSLSVINNNNLNNDNNLIPSSTHYGLLSLQIASSAAVKKVQNINDNNKQRLKNLHENGIEKIIQTTIASTTTTTTKHGNGNEINIQEHQQQQQQEQQFHHHSDDLEIQQQHQQQFDDIEMRRKPEKKLIDKKLNNDVVEIPEALNFLTIKQEPVEWIEYDHNGIEKTHMEIKPEILYAEEDEDSNDNQEPVYSPLTCELCSETFTIPGEWVRHIENHAETSHNIPKKRRRIDETNAENIAALRCDLCSMYFVTPAEWVRHVQNIHTETELAISNNSTLPKRTIRAQRPIDGQPLEKSCSICNKTFPSYASMVIHKRTHTGERPFYCCQCNKGFNVKSNLLRHMRTLHNQFLNPTNCNDGTDNSSNPE